MPLTFDVEVQFRLSPLQLKQALVAVNEAYGYPDGIPFTVDPPQELKMAHQRLRSTYAGRMTVEMVDPSTGLLVCTGIVR